MRTAPWPPPTGSPVGTWGWFRASDGRWYRTDTAPAPGWALGRDGRWGEPDEAWRASRWGLGDAWWGLLVYVVANVLLSVAVLATVAATGGDVDVDLGPYGISLLVIGNVAAFFGVPWFATRRKGLRSLREDFGFHLRPVDLAIGLGFGIGGLVGAGIVGSLIDAAFGVDESTSNIPVDSLGGPGEIVAFAISVAIVTPLIEELFFRGLIYRSLLKRGVSTWSAITWTTFVFVVPHLAAAEDLASLASLTASIAVLGLSFQLACHVTKQRLGASVVAHVVVNGAAVLALAVS